MSKQMAAVAVLAIGLGGCVVDGEETDELDGLDEESLEQVQSGLSLAGGAAWGTGGNNGQLLTLGSTANETCFLSGVTGSLIGNPSFNGSGFLPASVEVFPQNGTWFVKTRAGVGPGAMAHVTCVNVPWGGPSKEFTWSDNVPSAGLPDVPGRQCFLRKVWASGGLDGHVFSTGAVTNIKIRKVGGQWTFNGSYVHNWGGDWGFGGGTATCIDVPATGHWSFALTGPTNANNNATFTETLRNFYPNGPGVSITNVGCGLTGIGRRWISGSPNPFGWMNGVFLTRDDAVSPFWQLTVRNGRTAHVECIR